MAYEEKRCAELNDLVHATVKDLTHIVTRVSEDRENIVIEVGFGLQVKEIPIPIKDILNNVQSCKGFLDLLRTPLEALLVK